MPISSTKLVLDASPSSTSTARAAALSPRTTSTATLTTSSSSSNSTAVAAAASAVVAAQPAASTGEQRTLAGTGRRFSRSANGTASGHPHALSLSNTAAAAIGAAGEEADGFLPLPMLPPRPAPWPPHPLASSHGSATGSTSSDPSNSVTRTATSSSPNTTPTASSSSPAVNIATGRIAGRGSATSTGVVLHQLDVNPLTVELIHSNYTHSELVDMKLYLRSIRAPALFQELSSVLEREQPEDPVGRIAEWLEAKRAALGAVPESSGPMAAPATGSAGKSSLSSRRGSSM